MYLCAQSLVSHSNRADKKETRRCSNAFHVSHVWTPPKFSIVFMRNEAETQHLWKSQPEIIVKRRSQPLWHYGLYVLEGGEGGGIMLRAIFISTCFQNQRDFSPLTAIHMSLSLCACVGLWAHFALAVRFWLSLLFCWGSWNCPGKINCHSQISESFNWSKESRIKKKIILVMGTPLIS